MEAVDWSADEHDAAHLLALLSSVRPHSTLRVRITSTCRVCLPDTVHVKANSSALHIEGLVDGVVISGSAHSLFTVGGHASLVLHNLTLLHECAEQDPRNVGAAVYCRDRGSADLRRCRLLSAHGFACWCIQRSSLRSHQCSLSSSRRSGCVAFGASSVTMVESEVHDCPLHGVCIRGTASLHMTSSEVRCCGVRAIYVYHSATLTLDRVRVHHTGICPSLKHPGSSLVQHSLARPAVDVRADQQRYGGDSNGCLRFTLTDCIFDCNLAAALRVTGVVRGEVGSCEFTDNSCVRGSVVLSASLRLDGGVEVTERGGALVYADVARAADVVVDAGGADWQYLNEEAGAEQWRSYDPKACAHLEHEYQRRRTLEGDGRPQSVELSVCARRYAVDLAQMTQTNCSSHFERQIRRVAATEDASTCQDSFNAMAL